MGGNVEHQIREDFYMLERELETEDPIALWLNEFGMGPIQTWEHRREDLDALRQIVSQDYRDLPALPSRLTVRSAQQLIQNQVIPHPDLFGPRLCGSSFRCSSDDFCNDRLVVVGNPYRLGAGRSMWGFSADLRETSRREFMIYLNTAHAPGAIEATLVHEVGHYLFRLMDGGLSKQHNPMLPTFVSHMNEQSELFCDSLVSLTAFLDCRRQSYAGLDCLQVDQLFRRIPELHQTIGPNYFIDFSDAAISHKWRLKYLLSLVHFSKLRSALLEVTGL